jgi:peptide/nickel transport system ATP-binding protein
LTVSLPVQIAAADALTAKSRTPALSIRNLVTSFRAEDGVSTAVDDVSYDIFPGELLGVVGESGCGKSMTSLSIMGLVPPPGHVTGSIRLDGRELVGLPEREMRKIRGNDIAMIFQEPMTSLNPVMRIGRQIAEPLMLHQGMSSRQARARVVELMDLVRIPDASRRIDQFPHELSGGMRQRIVIAMGLACNPRVLLADEPTTALDVTVQAQILQLMKDLRRDLGTAIKLITHDLGVIAETVDRVVVMYAGRKVEEASVEHLFRSPRHPYTVGLLGSLPRITRGPRRSDVRLAEIPGMVSVQAGLRGCRFAPRCKIATARCFEAEPTLELKAADHLAACWHSERAGEAGRAN